MRDVEELRALGLPVWARWVRVRGAAKATPGVLDETVEVGGTAIRPGDAVVLDADGVVVVAHSASGRCSRPRTRARTRSGPSGPSSRAASCRTTWTGCGRSWRASAGGEPERVRDLAHIGHAELLTPRPEESLRFFEEVLGMQAEARAGQSVFLRGWGDYERYGLKLTESPQAGLGHMALRAWSPEALDRRVAAIEASGLGTGWIDGDLGHGPAYRFTDPDGHAMELYFETEKYEPPEELRPSLKNQPQRYVGRGAAVRRLDHVNVLAQDVAANRAFAEDVLGYRLYERIVLDDGTEAGAWLSPRSRRTN